MIIKRFADGRWILKRKFTFAAITGTIGSSFATYGLYVATTVPEVVSVFGAYSTFCTWLLGLVFAADVSDKYFNKGHYHDDGSRE